MYRVRATLICTDESLFRHYFFSLCVDRLPRYPRPHDERLFFFLQELRRFSPDLFADSQNQVLKKTNRNKGDRACFKGFHSLLKIWLTDIEAFTKERNI